MSSLETSRDSPLLRCVQPPHRKMWSAVIPKADRNPASRAHEACLLLNKIMNHYFAKNDLGGCNYLTNSSDKSAIAVWFQLLSNPRSQAICFSHLFSCHLPPDYLNVRESGSEENLFMKNASLFSGTLIVMWEVVTLGSNTQPACTDSTLCFRERNSSSEQFALVCYSLQD